MSARSWLLLGLALVTLATGAFCPVPMPPCFCEEPRSVRGTALRRGPAPLVEVLEALPECRSVWGAYSTVWQNWRPGPLCATREAPTPYLDQPGVPQ